MSRCHTLGSSPIISTFIANNLSPMMNLAEQLRDWADRTANFYHDIATSDPDCDLPFYTQSDLSQVRQRPELLILAILAALYALSQSVDRISSQQHRKGHVLPDAGRYALQRSGGRERNPVCLLPCYSHCRSLVPQPHDGQAFFE